MNEYGISAGQCRPGPGGSSTMRGRLCRSLIVSLLLGVHPDPGFAQGPAYATSCPPPLKLAAGACVRSCPAGYADTGRTCVFQDMSH
jgi:hypothetical protein